MREHDAQAKCAPHCGGRCARDFACEDAVAKHKVPGCGPARILFQNRSTRVLAEFNAKIDEPNRAGSAALPSLRTCASKAKTEAKIISRPGGRGASGTV